MTQLDESRRRGAAAVGSQRRGKKRGSGHPLELAPGRDGSDISKHPALAVWAAVITQAFKDAFMAKSEADRLDAILWIASDDCKLIAGSLGFEHNPLELLTSDQARVKSKVKREGKGHDNL